MRELVGFAFGGRFLVRGDCAALVSLRWRVLMVLVCRVVVLTIYRENGRTLGQKINATAVPMPAMPNSLNPEEDPTHEDHGLWLGLYKLSNRAHEASVREPSRKIVHQSQMKGRFRTDHRARSTKRPGRATIRKGWIPAIASSPIPFFTNPVVT